MNDPIHPNQPNQPNEGSKIESGKEHARKAAEDIKAAAGDLRSAAEAKAGELRQMAETKAAEFRTKAEHVYGDAKVRVCTLREDGEEYVRTNPTQSVLTAVAVGFVLGLLIRR